MLHRIFGSTEAQIARSRLFDYLVANSFCVFLFHDVSSDPSEFSRSSNLNVPPRHFTEQIQIIGRYFRFAEPDSVANGEACRGSALVTFDDGVVGTFENGIPILDRLEVPSVVFMNMAPVLGEIFWSGLVVYLFHKDKHFQRHRAAYDKYGPCDRRIVVERSASQIQILSPLFRKPRRQGASRADRDSRSHPFEGALMSVCSIAAPSGGFGGRPERRKGPGQSDRIPFISASYTEVPKRGLEPPRGYPH